ncbi:hypothetical protein [Nocardia vaccinii]|uniref:hypothetical protein n=1 Tax=Nocardia vaccinii TaxID=1822 RepID=UPI0008321BB0|nr:hypothetical protein [Nocardia vaccinii]
MNTTEFMIDRLSPVAIALELQRAVDISGIHRHEPIIIEPRRVLGGPVERSHWKPLSDLVQIVHPTCGSL